MHLMYPSFLWALIALAIPIIIHLFHFRRYKKVYFTNVHLLKEITDETSTRSKLKNILVLLSRLGALAALVFAFAQPIISDKDIKAQEQSIVCLLIDNSFSMLSTADEVPLFVMAKDRATEIINSFGARDQFIILTNDLLSKHQRIVDRSTALNFVEELSASPEVKTLSRLTEVVQRLTATKQGNVELFILSDFQSNISQFAETPDSSWHSYILPIRARQPNNVSITKAAFDAPVPVNGMSNSLIVDFQNFGTTDIQVPFLMSMNGINRPQGVINIPAGSTTTDTVEIMIDHTGNYEILLSIDDYPIHFDDELFLSFDVQEQVHILSIYENRSNKYLLSAFTQNKYYNLTQSQSNNITYNNFGDQELIILDDLRSYSSGLISEIEKYVSNGGNVLIFPAPDVELTSINTLLARLGTDRLGQKRNEERQVYQMNTEEFVFSDVYLRQLKNAKLPHTKLSYTLTTNNSSIKDRLLSYRDGGDFVTKYSHGKGQVYLCTSPLSDQYNDLVYQAEVFVPMLVKMALSTGNSRPLYYTIGAERLIEIDSDNGLQDATALEMVGPVNFIPGIVSQANKKVIDVQDQITEAGHYRLENNQTIIKNIAVNYDRKESDINYINFDDLMSQLPGAQLIEESNPAYLSSFIKQHKEGIHLWRWLLSAALIFLLIETLLLRFLK